MVDQVANFKKVTVSIGYDASATSIVLATGQGAELPDPSGDNYNLIWWDSTNYADPADDPNVEIVRVTAKSSDTLTVTRNQESSGASTKNTGSATYKMTLGPTAKTIADLESNGKTEKLWFPAEAAYLPITNPAALTEEVGATVYAGQSYLKYDDTTAEHAVWRGPIIDYDGGNIIITATAKVAATPESAKTLIFHIYAVGIANSESYDAADTVDTGVDITFNVDTTELLTDLMIATATIDPANVTNGDKIVIELIRNVATDTLVGDGELVDFTAKYIRT